MLCCAVQCCATGDMLCCAVLLVVCSVEMCSTALLMLTCRASMTDTRVHVSVPKEDTSASARSRGRM